MLTLLWRDVKHVTRDLETWLLPLAEKIFKSNRCKRGYNICSNCKVLPWEEYNLNKVIRIHTSQSAYPYNSTEKELYKILCQSVQAPVWSWVDLWHFEVSPHVEWRSRRAKLHTLHGWKQWDGPWHLCETPFSVAWSCVELANPCSPPQRALPNTAPLTMTLFLPCLFFHLLNLFVPFVFTAHYIHNRMSL